MVIRHSRSQYPGILVLKGTFVSKNTYLFTGNLKAQSHLATCTPSMTAKVAKGAPLPVPSFETERGRLLYMPGAGLRSKLRGAVTAMLLEALEARGAKRFSLTDAQLNRVGGIKQAGAESTLDAQGYLRMVAANPTIGLFGASTPWVKGKAMIGHLICKSPEIRPMRVDGVRADILKRDPGMVEFLDESSMQSYNDDIRRTKEFAIVKAEKAKLEAELRKANADERKKIREQLAAIDERVKKENLHHVSAQMPLSGYEAIPPGAELENAISLVGASDIELGGMLAALERFAENPVLGAHASQGAGVVSGSWEISKTRVGYIGKVTLKPFIGLEIEGEELLKAKEAFHAFIASDACQPYADTASMIETEEEEAA